MAFYSNSKRKDYVLNPRGKALYEDTNRFGTKMLEKMGWSKGKGLGTKLEGNLDFIKVSHKSDQKGIGFADRDDQWTQHEANFNSLLKSFDTSVDASSSASPQPPDNDNYDETPVTQGFGFKSVTKKSTSEQSVPIFSGISLEEQSKKSRARVHYKKFTRGKDMARYSEKDLANIFGKKSLNVSEVEELEIIKPVENENNDEDGKNEKTVDNNFGITVIETGTSINDYFKTKMEEMRRKNGIGNGGNPFSQSKKSANASSNDNTNNNDDDESSGVMICDDESSNSNNLKIKKKKNKKIDTTEENNEIDQLSQPPSKKKKKNNVENEILQRSPSPQIVIKKSKKKNKKDKTILEDIQNNSFENSTEVLLNNSICSQIEDFIVEKKKNILDNDDEIFEIPNELVDERAAVSTKNDLNDEIKLKQKKNKKITKNIEIEIENNVGKEKKNKKVKNISENIVDEMNNDNDAVEVIKKKKKKKNNKEVNQQAHFPKIISNLINRIYDPTTTVLDLNSNSDTEAETITTPTTTTSKTASNLPNASSVNQEDIVDSTIFEISKYKVEVFRFYDLNGFTGSNLSSISGYGFDKNLKLKIITSNKDAARINRFWDQLVDNKYGNQTVKSTKSKYKVKHAKLLKKNVFKI